MSKVIQLIEEITQKMNTAADVTRAVVAANPKVKAGSLKRGAIRFQPTDKGYDVNDLINTFRHLKFNVDSHIINPGQPHSGSSKFPTYKVTKDGKDFYIVLGGSSFGNKGMTFERQVLDELKNAVESGQPDPLLDKLSQLSGQKFVGVETGFNRAVRRQLSDHPNNMGSEISDVTLVDSKGGKHFISLKNKEGKTISNNGIAGIFKLQGDKVVPGHNEIVDKLIQASKVDLKVAAQGLNDYKNNTPSKHPSNVDVTSNLSKGDKQTILNYIASAIDYGYFYVKSKGNNNYEIVDLATPQDVYEFIGAIKSVNILYPFFNTNGKRKHVAIVVNTTKGKFSFDIRNTSGDLVPRQINLVRT